MAALWWWLTGCKAVQRSPARLREVPVKLRCQAPCKASAFCSSQQCCKPDPWIIWPRRETCFDLWLSLSLCSLAEWRALEQHKSYCKLLFPQLSISSELVPCGKFILVFMKRKLSCGVPGYSTNSGATHPTPLDMILSKHPNVDFQKKICKAWYTKMLLWLSLK